MSYRRLSIEPFENRMLLAGNVTAALTPAGDLMVEGDLEDNVLQLERISANKWKLSPANTTTLNGSNISLTFQVPRGINIALGDGNDIFGLLGQGSNKLTEGKSITVRGGAGNDLLMTNDLATKADVTVTGDEGDDQIYFEDSTIQRRLMVEGNSGKDNVVLTRVRVDGDARVDTGEMDDMIWLNDPNFKQNLTLVGGPGIDEVRIQGTNVAKTALIDLGSENEAEHDLLLIRTMNVGKDMTVRTGGGADQVNLEFLVVKATLDVKTSSGDDTLITDHLKVLDRFYLDMGSGDDEASILDSSARWALLDGGEGADTLWPQNFRVGRLTALNF